jgi:hypothetical protein
MSAKPVSSDYARVTYRRVARKVHHCDCGNRIGIGDAYLSHVAFPGHDALSLDETRPQRGVECARCATRYGRGWEVDPTWDQCAREGLL